MSIRIKIPTALRRLTGNQTWIEVEAATIGEAVQKLTEMNGELKSQLMTDQGRLRNFVRIFLNDDDVATLEGMDTELSEGDEVMIVPAIAGGSSCSGGHA
jgi:MoaD family protein